MELYFQSLPIEILSEILQLLDVDEYESLYSLNEFKEVLDSTVFWFNKLNLDFSDINWKVLNRSKSTSFRYFVWFYLKILNSYEMADSLRYRALLYKKYANIFLIIS